MHYVKRICELFQLDISQLNAILNVYHARFDSDNLVYLSQTNATQVHIKADDQAGCSFLKAYSLKTENTFKSLEIPIVANCR